MKGIPRAASVAAAFTLAVARLSSQTPGQKPSFETQSDCVRWWMIIVARLTSPPTGSGRA